MPRSDSLTVDEIVEAANKHMLAASLSSASIGIEIHMANRLPGPEATHDQALAVRVDDVHVVGVARVQPHVAVVPLEEGAGRVQPGDPAEVLQLVPGEAGHVGAEAEADHVGVAVDVLAHGLVDALDQQGHLKNTLLMSSMISQKKIKLNYLTPDQTSVDGRSYIIWIRCSSLPVDAHHVAIFLRKKWQALEQFIYYSPFPLQCREINCDIFSGRGL